MGALGNPFDIAGQAEAIPRRSSCHWRSAGGGSSESGARAGERLTAWIQAQMEDFDRGVERRRGLLRRLRRRLAGSTIEAHERPLARGMRKAASGWWT